MGTQSVMRMEMLLKEFWALTQSQRDAIRNWVEQETGLAHTNVRDVKVIGEGLLEVTVFDVPRQLNQKREGDKMHKEQHTVSTPPPWWQW